jgi:hypothetical protein
MIKECIGVTPFLLVFRTLGSGVVRASCVLDMLGEGIDVVVISH